MSEEVKAPDAIPELYTQEIELALQTLRPRPGSILLMRCPTTLTPEQLEEMCSLGRYIAGQYKDVELLMLPLNVEFFQLDDKTLAEMGLQRIQKVISGGIWGN